MKYVGYVLFTVKNRRLKNSKIHFVKNVLSRMSCLIVKYNKT